MRTIKKFVLVITLFFIANIYAEPLPSNLIAINSAAAKPYFADITLSAHFWGLMQQFTSEQSMTYCGVASSVMVLNAMQIPAPVDPVYTAHPYFTQDDFFSPAVTALISPETIKTRGMALDELGAALATYPVHVKVIHADQITLPAFRKLLYTTLVADDGYMIVNFDRPTLGEAKGTHISPLAAYDKKRDAVLLLDVARYRYPSVWVSVPDMYRAMKTLDGKHYRGLVVVQNK